MSSPKHALFIKHHIFPALHVSIQIIFVYCLAALVLALPFWSYVFFLTTDVRRFFQLYDEIVVAFELIWKGTELLPIYSPEEVSHLLDVHYLILKTVVFLPFLYGVIRATRSRIPLSIWKAVLLVWFFLTIGILLTFSFFFEIFHRLFFPQGNYAFAADSTVIITFPLFFWISSFIVLQLIVISWMGWKVSRAAREKF